MTIDQAIYILRNTAWSGSDKDMANIEQAVWMAVDGLTTLKHIMDSGDCITCASFLSQCRYAPRLESKSGIIVLFIQRRKKVKRNDS